MNGLEILKVQELPNLDSYLQIWIIFLMKSFLITSHLKIKSYKEP